MIDVTPSIIELIREGKALFDKFNKQQKQKSYQKAHIAQLTEGLPEFLEYYYSVPVLTRENISYPVFVSPSPKSQRQEIELICGRLTQAERPEIVINDKNYLSYLQSLGKELINRQTYVLDHFVDGDIQKVECSLGHFFDAMTSCDALEHELLTKLNPEPLHRSGFNEFKKKLPFRNKYHQKNKNPVYDGAGRSAALSISTFIVFFDGETYKGLIRMRSSKTAHGSDFYHVLPSAIFQPIWGFVPQEYSTTHNIYREYLEEVFGYKELERTQGEVDYQYFYEFPEMKYLKNLLETQQARLFYTGYALNLLNLRPEICTLLIIHDQNWKRQKIKPNWEFASVEPLLPLDVLRTDRELLVDLSNIPGTFVTPGAAAFWLGVDLAKEILSKRSF